MKGPPSARILIATFGSRGDVDPMVALGIGLQRRGHRVTIGTSETYRDLIESFGLSFVAVRPNLAEMLIDSRALLDSDEGTEYLVREMALPFLEESHADLLAAAEGADLLVTHMLTFAGPIVAEQLGLPWVSTVLAPMWVSPVDEQKREASRSWMRPVARLRNRLGLAEGGHPLYEGQHAAGLGLALFSGLFASPAEGWPPGLRTTGFCLLDQPPEQLPRELARFLDDGPPPLVFTLGSLAIWDPGRFYTESARAAHALGRRALLLTGRRENRPPPELLSDAVVAFEYAPYHPVFARAAAIVHQGGIGTTAHALRAGKPMLVVPFAHDQQDNAAHVARLRVGRVLQRGDYEAHRVAADLQALLDDHDTCARIAALGRALGEEDGVRTACDLLDAKLGDRDGMASAAEKVLEPTE
jgi:rhamnosyltransferase subunit B